MIKNLEQNYISIVLVINDDNSQVEKKINLLPESSAAVTVTFYMSEKTIFKTKRSAFKSPIRKTSGFTLRELPVPMSLQKPMGKLWKNFPTVFLKKQRSLPHTFLPKRKMPR